MLLTLARHGDARSPTNDLGDAGRCLSIRGRAEASAAGRALASRGVTPTRVWCSPLVRAVQTAELMLAAVQPNEPSDGQSPDFAGVVEARDDVYPDSRPSALFRALSQLPADADVLVVGHMPYMAGAATELLDAGVSGFSTGAAFRFDVTTLFPHRVTLKWRWLGRFVD